MGKERVYEVIVNPGTSNMRTVIMQLTKTEVANLKSVFNKSGVVLQFKELNPLGDLKKSDNERNEKLNLNEKPGLAEGLLNEEAVENCVKAFEGFRNSVKAFTGFADAVQSRIAENEKKAEDEAEKYRKFCHRNIHKMVNDLERKRKMKHKRCCQHDHDAILDPDTKVDIMFSEVDKDLREKANELREKGDMPIESRKLRKLKEREASGETKLDDSKVYVVTEDVYEHGCHIGYSRVIGVFTNPGDATEAAKFRNDLVFNTMPSNYRRYTVSTVDMDPDVHKTPKYMKFKYGVRYDGTVDQRPIKVDYTCECIPLRYKAKRDKKYAGYVIGSCELDDVINKDVYTWYKDTIDVITTALPLLKKRYEEENA